MVRSNLGMKQFEVVVPWKQGLHMRAATGLVRYALGCRSSIHLKVRERIADARSIVGVLLLCATLGTVVQVVVAGEDEEAVGAVVEKLFEPGGGDDNDGPDHTSARMTT